MKLKQQRNKLKENQDDDNGIEKEFGGNSDNKKYTR